ncbi:MAG: type 1 glutamine amidotransferase-like domain-containing protein, partial [Flavobacteriaceae bacterium]|nr:type 1 glutamine amidotransferase-like domain-containing protein [Flavobacteriaceae bacterium]
MQKIKGTLIPIGGNEDKGIHTEEKYTLEFVEAGILAHVVRETGGIESKIVIIPTASGIPEEVGENYLHAFRKLGCKDLTVLDIREREDSEKQEAIALVSEANCIMFSGGDQSRISDRIGGTKLHDIIKQRYFNDEGFVVAGTSAGAMAMAEEMI